MIFILSCSIWRPPCLPPLPKSAEYLLSDRGLQDTLALLLFVLRTHTVHLHETEHPRWSRDFLSTESVYKERMRKNERGQDPSMARQQSCQQCASSDHMWSLKWITKNLSVRPQGLFWNDCHYMLSGLPPVDLGNSAEYSLQVLEQDKWSHGCDTSTKRNLGSLWKSFSGTKMIHQ